MPRVWSILTELRALPGSSFPGSAESQIYTTCFVPRTDVRDALDAAAAALRDRRYEVTDVSECRSFDPAEAGPDDGPIRAVAERVLASGEVELGPFTFYDPNADG